MKIELNGVRVIELPDGYELAGIAAGYGGNPDIGLYLLLRDKADPTQHVICGSWCGDFRGPALVLKEHTSSPAVAANESNEPASSINAGAVPHFG